MEGFPKGTRTIWESLFRARVGQGRPCHGHRPGKDSPPGAMGPGALGMWCLVRKNAASGKAGLSKQEGGMGTSRSGRGSSRRGPGQHCSDEASRCFKGLSRKEGLRKEQRRCGHWKWGRSFRGRVKAGGGFPRGIKALWGGRAFKAKVCQQGSWGRAWGGQLCPDGAGLQAPVLQRMGRAHWEGGRGGGPAGM